MTINKPPQPKGYDVFGPTPHLADVPYDEHRARITQSSEADEGTGRRSADALEHAGLPLFRRLHLHPLVQSQPAVLCHPHPGQRRAAHHHPRVLQVERRGPDAGYAISAARWTLTRHRMNEASRARWPRLSRKWATARPGSASRWGPWRTALSPAPTTISSC